MRSKSYCLYMIDVRTEIHTALFSGDYKSVLIKTHHMLENIGVSNLFEVLDEMCQISEYMGVFRNKYSVPPYFVNLVLRKYNLIIDIGEMEG